MPKPNHPNHPPANPNRKVIDVAKNLAVAGMSARMFDKYDKPEEAAKYCIDVATSILKYDTDIDVDDDRG